MSDAVKNWQDVRNHIASSLKQSGRKENAAQLVAVSKNFTADDILPILEAGQRIFGENRVQETQNKWPLLRKTYDNIELHLIGPLQSNKAAEAVALFDVIETVDREKIAVTLAQEMQKQQRQLACYVQVNTGLEPQKAGINPQDALSFVRKCREELKLDIIGLMCIPPVDENHGPHFALLKKLAGEADISLLSMGMSGDYETAIAFGATSVRVGSAIFGARQY